MILIPPVLALLVASALSCLGMLGCSLFAVQLLCDWDRRSGSRHQLMLERRATLVSTVLVLVMLVEAASVLVYVFTMDKLAIHITGAMCAVGSMNASEVGFPLLLVGLATFFGAATWLVLDHLDNQSPRYPLVRTKYALLLALTLLVLTRAGLLYEHFQHFEANVAVSCCSSTFAPTSTGVMADMSGIPPGQALALYYGVLALVVVVGLLALGRPHLRVAYSLLAAAHLGVTLLAVISVFSLYIYEHPNHHCPFCFLKYEYAYAGYLLYAPMLLGTALALGVGAVELVRHRPGLEELAPAHSRWLMKASLALLGITGLLLTLAVARSNLVLLGT